MPQHAIIFLILGFCLAPSTFAAEDSKNHVDRVVDQSPIHVFHLANQKISLDCRDFLRASARPSAPTETRELLSTDRKKGVLAPNLIKPTPEILLESIIQAEAWALKSFRSPLTFHASQTHSWIDTLRQCRIAAVGIEDYENVTNLCRSIIWLHLIDDLKETAKISIEDFLSRFKSAFMKNEAFPSPDLFFFNERNQILQVLNQSLFDIHQSLSKTNLPLRKQLFYFGLEKMLNGDRLFQSNSVARFQHQIELSAKFGSSSKRDSAMKDLIESLDPLFVAFTVNSLFESIEVFQERVPGFHVIQLQNLIYGPIVNFHDFDAEVKKEGRSIESLPTLQLVKSSYDRILSVVIQLPIDEQRMIWSRFPWILESFAGVLPKDVRLFFSNFLRKLDTAEVLPDWSETEINHLHRILVD